MPTEDTDDEDYRPTPKCFVKGCPNRYKTHSHPEMRTKVYINKEKQEEIQRAKAYGTTHISYVSYFDDKGVVKPKGATIETINLKS